MADVEDLFGHEIGFLFFVFIEVFLDLFRNVFLNEFFRQVIIKNDEDFKTNYFFGLQTDQLI